MIIWYCEGIICYWNLCRNLFDASPDQLEEAKTNLGQLIKNDFKGKVVFIGENGLNLAKIVVLNYLL